MGSRADLQVLTEHGCPIAPSTYYDARTRTPSARDMRDEALKVEIAKVHAEKTVEALAVEQVERGRTPVIVMKPTCSITPSSSRSGC